MSTPTPEFFRTNTAQETNTWTNRLQGFHYQGLSSSPPRRPCPYRHLWSCAAAEGKTLSLSATNRA